MSDSTLTGCPRFRVHLSSPLENLVSANKLKVEAPSQEEFDNMLRSGRIRLKDAENDQLSLESRFDLAYNAAHILSLAALRWHGYRSDSRYLVFQCLKHTLDLPNDQWRVLDEAHRIRNLTESEGRTEASRSLVEATIRVAREVESLATQLGPLK